MNELAGKLAELLDITVKQAIELYPVLRTQYVWYVILENIIITAGLVMTIIGIFIFIFAAGWIVGVLPDSLESDEEKTKRLFVVLLKVLAASVIIVVLGSVSSAIVAPDLNFILRVLDK